jgi:hypothetical protein
VRAEVPVALLPAHRRRVERRAEVQPPARGARRARGRRRGRAGRAVELDGGMRAWRRAPLAPRAPSSPVHQRISTSVAGPNAYSQRRSSSAWAAAVSTSGAPSGASVPAVLPVRPRAAGRPRTIAPSAPAAAGTRDAALTSASQRVAVRRGGSFVARSGSARVRSDGEAPRHVPPARRAPAAATRSTSRAGSSATPLCATNCSSLRRSRAATSACRPRPPRARARAARPRASCASRASARASARRRAPLEVCRLELRVLAQVERNTVAASVSGARRATRAVLDRARWPGSRALSRCRRASRARAPHTRALTRPCRSSTHRHGFDTAEYRRYSDTDGIEWRRRRISPSERKAAARRRTARRRADASSCRRGFPRRVADEIAEEAGYTKGAVYSNFAGKDDLYLALLDAHYGAAGHGVREP